MKKILLCALLILMPASQISAKQGTAIAFMAGVPMGMNFKPWLDERTALNVNFCYNILNARWFLNFDILRHWPIAYNMFFYTGGGLVLQINSDTKVTSDVDIGIRALIGTELMLAKGKYSIFLEGGGLLGGFQVLFTHPKDYYLKNVLRWNASIGFRYYLSH